MISATAQDIVNEVHTQGYTVLKNAIPPEIIADLLDFAGRFEYTPEETEKLLRNQQRLNAYGRNVYNVAVKRPDTLSLFIRGLQGEVLRGLLNDRFYRSIPEELPNFVLRSLLLRSSLEAMPYHIDSFIPYTGNHTSVVQAIIFLNDSKRDNGCSLVVPGSHNSGEYAPQGDNPDAIPLEAEAGDLVIWDSRIWHATLGNESQRDRWALVATFCRWFIKQGFDYPRSLSRAQFDHLDIDEKIVFGYASYTPVDEFDKTEVKGDLSHIKPWRD